MLPCPPLEMNHHAFRTVEKYVSAILTLINVYVIICIVFRSPSVMKRYRWYLLFHQIVGTCVDLYGSTFMTLYVVFPFPIYYGLGPLGKILSAHYMFLLVCFLILFGLTTSVHLFHYRFLVAQGIDRFPLKHKIGLSLVYVCSCIPSISYLYIGDETENILRDMDKEYQCIDAKQLLSIAPVVIYDLDKFVKISIPATIFTTCVITSLLLFFVVRTLSLLRNPAMSAQTRNLQRRFFYALCLQVFAPLVWVSFPVCILVAILMSRIFGYSGLGLLCVGMMSTQGAVGGIMLVAVQPSYRRLKWSSNSTTVQYFTSASHHTK